MTPESAGVVTVLITSPRLPVDQLTAEAWDVLRRSTVYVDRADHPIVEALRAVGVSAVVAAGSPSEIASAVSDSSPAVWVSHDGDEGVVQGLGERAEVVTVVGSADPPGARLLDAVRVMDRLRSAGGCPWDAEQTHASLAKYLLEEAYETVELIESGQLAELVEEIGDVLLQVVFHARVASERTDGTGWNVDDVAAGLVDKLVRRHPHVFGDLAVDGSAQVVANWDVLKAQEKGRTSVTEGVPLAQPALALTEKLMARSGRAGLPVALADEGLASGDAAEALRGLLDSVPSAVERDADDAASEASTEAFVGRLLLLAVALSRSLGVNPETALRGSARSYADRIRSAEDEARAPS